MAGIPYNQRLLGLLRNQEKQIDNIYNRMAVNLSNVLKKHKVNPKALTVWSGGNSAIEKEINKLFQGFGSTMIYLMKSNINQAWELGNLSADGLANDYLKGMNLPDAERAKMFYRNSTALAAFNNRKTAGMNLSQRVWNITDSTKGQLETIVGSGILEGKSAAKISRDLRQTLKEPNKLFRRVRAADGTLKLSKPALDYHPGRGVYRSSYKNAMRLARTETNMAYRAADNLRRQSMPFVTGFTVNLSNAHPAYDICDELTGDYPKNFNFVGWHPHCLCFTTAKLLPKKDFIKYLNGEPIAIGKQIRQIPKNAQSFISANSERFLGYKNKPYFLDNFKNVKGEFVWNPNNVIPGQGTGVPGLPPAPPVAPPVDSRAAKRAAQKALEKKEAAELAAYKAKLAAELAAQKQANRLALEKLKRESAAELERVLANAEKARLEKIARNKALKKAKGELAFIPENLEAYEVKMGVKVDRSIFKLLKGEVPLRNPITERGGALYDPGKKFVKIPINKRLKRSKFYSEKIFYHEYGHAVDWQYGLRMSPEVRDVMHTYRTKFRKAKSELYRKHSKQLSIDYNKAKWVDKNYDLAEEINSTADTLCSLNPSYAWGHSKKYFSYAYMREAEFIAHAFENNIAGNKYFKKLMPDLYEDMIKMIETFKKNIAKDIKNGVK